MSALIFRKYYETQPVCLQQKKCALQSVFVFAFNSRPLSSCFCIGGKSVLEQRLHVCSSYLTTFLLACLKHLGSKFVTHSSISSFMNLKTLLLKESNLTHTSCPKDSSCHLRSVSLSEVAKFKGTAVITRRQSALCMLQLPIFVVEELAL